MRIRRESDLYPLILAWLDRRGYYCGGDQWIRHGRRRRERPYVNLGLANTRLDVLGVRSIGSDFHDEIEIAAVEVKKSSDLSVQHLNQAAGYARYVERCYFAKPGSYSDEQIQEALRLRLGLLSLDPKGKPKVRVVIDVGVSTPHTNLKNELLHKLWLHQCTLCRVFFFAYDYQDDDTRN